MCFKGIVAGFLIFFGVVEFFFFKLAYFVDNQILYKVSGPGFSIDLLKIFFVVIFFLNLQMDIYDQTITYLWLQLSWFTPTSTPDVLSEPLYGYDQTKSSQFWTLTFYNFLYDYLVKKNVRLKFSLIL